MQVMSLLGRLESRFGRWAIPNLTAVIIAGQGLLFFLHHMRGGQEGFDALQNAYFDPAKVMQGEIWRLFSFPFVPFSTNFLWVLISWMIFYMFGSTLDNAWGTVRYNVFLYIGYFANVGAAFFAWMLGSDFIASNSFLYGTVFLAFARLFPNYVIHVYFILPIKIKWLALLMWIGYGYGMISGPGMDRLLIIASIFNYLVFFGRDHYRELKGVHRQRSFQAKEKFASKLIKHCCLVCGLNSNDSPKTLFRYCSKCAGQSCYCPDHIREHEHVIEKEMESQLAEADIE